MSHLQDERDDGGAERRVVTELLQVAAVLPFGPNGHLDETHQCEESHWQALGHQREAEPGAQLTIQHNANEIIDSPNHFQVP